MYCSPAVTRYSREELQELMGPVETQYCDVTAVTASPDQIIQSKTDITLSFDIDPCETFATVDVALINENNIQLITDTYSRGQGMESGTIWTLPVFDFGITLDPGDYVIEVILTDATGETSQPGYASFTVL